MFKECGLIEKYGSGIGRIKRYCKEYGLIEPKFEEIQKGFQVTVYKETIKENLNEGVKNLYNVIIQYPNHRTPFYAETMNTSIKNIERWLKQLKKEKKVEFKGSSKTGGYYAS